MGKRGFYPRLAAQNIRKNSRFYTPYLLTGVFCAAMLYTMYFLNGNEGVSKMSGSVYVLTFLWLGIGVVTIFSAIVMLYTNSFLMKRRRKEIGLYNVLGMEKRHIARFMAWETVYAALISIVGGIVLGVLLSKLALLLLCRILRAGVPFGFEVSGFGMGATAVTFVVIFFLCLAGNLRRVGASRPVELLRSESEGDREPKTRWGLAVVGAVCLGAGYVMALTVKDAIAALGLFFVAVLLVIAGTYCLFTAGSIAALKALRRNKKYYYQTRHFTAVSGMLHRMKRNAAGLASVCILSTMVLVTVSTTVSLYLGTEEVLDRMYPRDYNVVMFEADENAMESALRAVAALDEENEGAEFTDIAYVRYYQGDKDALSANQECCDALKAAPENGALVWAKGNEDGLPTVYVGFNVKGQVDGDDVWNGVLEGMDGEYTYRSAYVSSRAANAEEVYAMDGGFFFMGLYLGALFLMATVLIIYYKQLSEGYEDAGSFRIMQRLGMSQAEVRGSIHSQIMIVFFLPLLAAAVHIAFAFNMIVKMLYVFSLSNTGLFAVCTLGTLLVFAAIYAFVYAVTARAYYRIVRI